MSAYQYEPLSSAPDSIRLLLLQPSDARDAKLKGSLLNTTLAECDYDLIDRYTALSYVWGSSEKPCQILLDDKTLAITRSLNDALRDMRDATRIRRIWADAICINQEDIPERNSQVLIMKDVYSTAHSTVIYLGDLTTELDAIFEAGPPKRQRGMLSMDAFPHGVDKQDFEIAGADILSRPWFTRVWVLQELIFSSDPWVQCSTKRMRWADLNHLFFGWEPYGESVMYEMNSFRECPPTFERVLQSRRGYGAQDPRDLVYANIGACKGQQGGLIIDYNNTLVQTFTEAALFINSSGFCPTKMISQVDDVPGEKRLPGLPSWAPDWRLQPPPRCRLDVHLTDWERDQIISSDHESSHIRMLGELHAFTNWISPPVLYHLGIKIGVIESISGIIPKKGSQENPSPVAKDFQQIYNKLAEMSHNTRTFEEQQKHCEVEHGNCCDLLSGSWSRWFDNLHETPQVKGSGSKDFLSHFCQWVSKQSIKTPKFRMEDGGSDSKLWSSIFECLQCYCGHREGRQSNPYAVHSPGEEFEGRRLAFTQDGRCGLVPSQVRKGDMLGLLMGGRLPAIFRPKRLDWNSIAHRAVALESRSLYVYVHVLNEGHASLPGMECKRRPIDRWQFSTSDDALDVEHYSIIGECFFEGCHGMLKAVPPNIENIRVFVLH